MKLRLHEFYDMPLNEILIAMDYCDRKRDVEVLDTQFIAYHSLVGPHVDPRKIPSFKKFINVEVKTASSEAKSVFIDEYKEYLKIKASK